MDPISFIAIVGVGYCAATAATIAAAKAYDFYRVKKRQKKAFKHYSKMLMTTQDPHLSEGKPPLVSNYIAIENLPSRERRFVMFVFVPPKKVSSKKFKSTAMYPQDTCAVCLQSKPEVLYKPCLHLAVCKRCDFGWTYNQFNRVLEGNPSTSQRANKELFSSLEVNGSFKCPVCSQAINQRVSSKKPIFGKKSKKKPTLEQTEPQENKSQPPIDPELYE